MKRTLTLAFALVGLGLAQVASAASVVVTADDTTPTPGQTITLSVLLNVTPADGTDTSLFGALVFPTSGIQTPVTVPTTVPFPSSGAPYAPGALSCTSVRCVVLNHVAGTQGAQTANVSNFVITTQPYTITGAAGTVLTWTWQTTPSTQLLSVYGAPTPVPALQITVVPVPEPTTAAMLGLGLLGLAMAGRRRA